MARKRQTIEARRAIGYLRVSTTMQRDEGFGLDVQRDRVQEYVRAKRLELLDVATEAASGGVRDGEEFSYEHRPVLRSLVDRAREQRDFDVLLVPRYDRLSRDYATLIVLERRFAGYDVEIVSVAEEFNGDGPIATFIRGQFALAAELDKALIRERLSGGKVKAKAAGRHVDGRLPYGYLAPERGVLVPDIDPPAPKPAKLAKGEKRPPRPPARPRINEDDRPGKVVQFIYEEIARGISPGLIALVLNAAWVPAPKGGRKWRDRTVRIIARNPVYVSPGSAAHEPLIGKRMWNTAQRQLDARTRPKTG